MIWLPPYSPDFSPIEPLWGKLKTYLRKVKARTIAELDRAVAEGLRLITPSDCRGWFTHCGYQVAYFCNSLYPFLGASFWLGIHPERVIDLGEEPATATLVAASLQGNNCNRALM